MSQFIFLDISLPINPAKIGGFLDSFARNLYILRDSIAYTTMLFIFNVEYYTNLKQF